MAFFDSIDPDDFNRRPNVIEFISIDRLKLERKFFHNIFLSATIIVIRKSTHVSIDRDAFDDMSELSGFTIYDLKFEHFYSMFRQNLSNPKLKRTKSLNYYTHFDIKRIEFEFFKFTFTEFIQIDEKKFCDYKQFPHDQIILVLINDGQIDSSDCLHLFLSLNNYIFFPFLEKYSFDEDLFTRMLNCSFDQRLNECYKMEGRKYEPIISNFSLYIQDMAAYHKVNIEPKITTIMKPNVTKLEASTSASASASTTTTSDLITTESGANRLRNSFWPSFLLISFMKEILNLFKSF